MAIELLLVLTLLVGLLVSTILFSAFHSKLPPSPIALPIIGHFHLLGPIIHQSLHKLSLRYGPLFSLRLGSVPCIVASTPEYAKELLKTNELSFTSRKHTIAIDRLTYNSSFAFAPSGPYWIFMKKLSANELLGSRTVNAFISLREKEYRRLLRVLADKSEAGEAVNVTEELLKLTNNIISQMMLGRAEEARAVIREVVQIFGEFNVSDYIWFCKHLDLQGFGKRIEDIHRRFDALVEKIITERKDLWKKKENGERERDGREHQVRDFMDILLDFSEDENSEIKLTRAHIKALIVVRSSNQMESFCCLQSFWSFFSLIFKTQKKRQKHQIIDRSIYIFDQF
jgi:cytochrome P450